jgi:DNA-directed RNA polymerase alpha subunit
VSEIMDSPVRDLWAGEPPSALATTAANALFRADIYTVRELTGRTAQDLLGERQIGPALLAEVRRVLKRQKPALYLKGESP